MSAGNWVRLLVLAVLWGGSFLFVEIALTELPPLSVVWARVALAAMILVAVLAVTGQGLPRRHRDWAALAVMGLLNNVIPFSLFALAQGQITGGLAAILNATTPLFALVVAHLATADERITRAKTIGLTVGLGGVVVMTGGGSGAPGAMAMCLAAALSYALAGVWGRRFRRLGLAPLTSAFGQVACASLILLPLWLWQDRPWTLPIPSGPVLAAVLGIAALSTALAYLLYFRLLAEAGAVNLLLVTFLIPLSATALGALILGERLHLAEVAGFGLIALALSVIDGRLWRGVRT